MQPYEGSVRFVKAARDAGLRRAVVSSSTNCRDVLVAAGILDLFEEIVDGVVAEREHLPGKPAADTFLAAARKVGVAPDHAAVFEDALAGVEAGHAGSFGLVVGRRSRRAGRRAQAARRRRRREGPGRASGAVVIRHPSFRCEPWEVCETDLRIDELAQRESVFALSNGHIGLRGNLDEGEPYGLPGTYLAGFYELRPLPYGESGYGYPEEGQTVVNVTNGKIIRLLVEDEPFDVRYGTLESHERVLDLQAGLLSRTLVWSSPARRRVRVSSTRLVSFAQRAIAAIRYTVESLDDRIPIVVQSELVANESVPVAEDDPRAAAVLGSPLHSMFWDASGTRAVLMHSTRSSELTIGAAMDHVLEAPPDTGVSVEAYEDVARLTTTATVGPGQPLTIIKFLAYGWSRQRSMPSIRDQVAAALAGAMHTGWDGLVDAQRSYLDDFWERRGRRDRGRRRAPAGDPFRDVSYPAGRRPHRAARDRGEGAHRSRLRRTQLLGHRDVRAAGAHLHRRGRRGRRASLAPSHP